MDIDFGKYTDLVNAFMKFLTDLFTNLGIKLNFTEKLGGYKDDLLGIAGAAKDAFTD